MNMFAPLMVGILFGWLLERAGLTRYDRVAGVYRFSDLTLLKFLGTALAVGAFVVQAALSLEVVTSVPIMPTHPAANLLGGALFGVGMALAGFCPGTILAGAGAGQLDYLLPGIGGLFAGALAFGWSYESFMPALRQMGHLSARTLPELFGINSWLLIILLVEVALIGFYASERGLRRPPRGA